ncbi:MAG: hypothetical protein ABSF70_11055 [Terracidiphilus sp.]|jgi:hypothetical protein
MKRIAWALVLLFAAPHAWAASKITVGQLEDLLHSLQQSKKTDAEVADKLKDVELTEELTTKRTDNLVSALPGKLSIEQIYVLEARSAVLAPPAVDLPNSAAPDAAAQKTLLDKAVSYVNNLYVQQPHLTATKTTLRFQDNTEAVSSASSFRSGTSADEVRMNDNQATPFVHYINATEAPVEIQNGAEMVSRAKDSTRWGANAMIVLKGQGPVLSTVLREAQTAGKMNWLRWETVSGRTTAVFAYSVDQNTSRYAVKYCCFPDIDRYGETKDGLNWMSYMQASTNWKDFTATVPYHGEIFVDQRTGIVLRLITEAEFKASDLVHLENQRIDYGPVTVGGKPMVLPIKAVINTEVSANGDATAGRFVTRRTLFSVSYKDYQLAGAAH